MDIQYCPDCAKKFTDPSDNCSRCGWTANAKQAVRTEPIFGFEPKKGATKKAKGPKIKCPKCQYKGRAIRENKGYVLIEILLYFFYILPGIFYTIWSRALYRLKCPKCDCEDIFLSPT